VSASADSRSACCDLTKAAERAYNRNPYHNSMHAADVAQTLGVMLAHDRFREALTELEVLAMLFAAITHDVGHPGARSIHLSSHPRTQDVGASRGAPCPLCLSLNSGCALGGLAPAR
jgi:3'5'-cyclic nucleotide phosphodiesterase